MSTPTSPRSRLKVVAVSGLAAAGALAVVALGGMSPAAAAQAATCPTGQIPNVGNVVDPKYTDANVAVYAGGDYLATGRAAESEGLLLVDGDATFDKTTADSKIFNVGWVGVGSGILPAAGTQMLAVGGDLTVVPGTRIQVGTAAGGLVTVGGVASGTINTGTGMVKAGLGAAAATAPNTNFGALLDATSAELAGLAANGAVSGSGARLTFTGTPGADLQVFTITAAQASAALEHDFRNIPAGAAVLVNITGSGAVTFSPYWQSADGARIDYPVSGDWSSRILWNFADATSLTVGGTSQVIGSILAPAAAQTTITASTNGRLHVGGNLTTHGTGNEQHNYPWIGRTSLNCSPVPTTPPVTTPPVTTPPVTTPPVTTPPVTTPPAQEPEPTDPPAKEFSEPDPSTPPTTQPASPAGTGEATVAAEGGGTGLASTGFEYAGVGLGATVMLAVAGTLLFVARRRRA